jgi:hypothetical protein
MFAYSPTPDRSGEIMAAGQMQAANTNAQMMSDLGQNIGGALAGIGEMYGEIEGRKAKGRAFKKTLEVMGPSLGMTTDKLKAAFGDIKSDMDYANLSETLMPIMPAWINSTLASGRMGIQQNQPFVNAGLDNAADIAAGNKTFTGGGGSGNIDRSGMKPVEPPLTMDGATPPDENAPLPPSAGAPNVAPSPAPTPAQTMPGGSQSKEAYNRWLRSQGLPPIP